MVPGSSEAGELPGDVPRPSQAGNQLPGWNGKPPLFPTRMLNNWQGCEPDRRPSLETCKELGRLKCLPRKKRDRPLTTKLLTSTDLMPHARHWVRCYISSITFLPKANTEDTRARIDTLL